MSRETRTHLISLARWIARLLVLIVSGPFIYFLLVRSKAVIPNLDWSRPNGMPLFVAWVAVVGGILLAFRWERIGGLITGLFGVAVGILAYVGCGRGEFVTCLLVSGPYVLAGLLLLGAHWASGQGGHTAARESRAV